MCPRYKQELEASQGRAKTEEERFRREEPFHCNNRSREGTHVVMTYDTPHMTYPVQELMWCVIVCSFRRWKVVLQGAWQQCANLC